MEIAEIVRSVVGDAPVVPLHQPLLCGNEQEYAAQVIDSGHLSAGRWVERFEWELVDFLGAKHAVGVCNATCGLQAAITCMDLPDTLSIPSLTFIATANAVKHSGRTPRFTETDHAISVNVLGHATRTNGAIRDAAQALGSRPEDGHFVGDTGTAVFSFNQNKIITTGGGGMVVTDDSDLAARIKHLVTTARIPHKWECECDTIGFNYRMSDLQAAVGVAQLEQLPLILKAKRALAAQYKKAFAGMAGVAFWDEPKGCESNFWLNAIMLDDPAQLIPTLEALHAAGIQARRLWKPLHTLDCYKDSRRSDMATTEDLYSRTICLPSSPHLGMRYL